MQLDCSATVTNLQAKVESLTTTNALLNEDLSISNNSILCLQYENKQLKKELGIEVKDHNEVFFIYFVHNYKFSSILSLKSERKSAIKNHGNHYGIGGAKE